MYDTTRTETDIFTLPYIGLMMHRNFNVKFKKKHCEDKLPETRTWEHPSNPLPPLSLCYPQRPLYSLPHNTVNLTVIWLANYNNLILYTNIHCLLTSWEAESRAFSCVHWCSIADVSRLSKAFIHIFLEFIITSHAMTIRGSIGLFCKNSRQHQIASKIGGFFASEF